VKITFDDLRTLNEEPIELFYHGIKAEATKEKYTRTLRRTLCDILEDVLQGTFEERASEMVNKAKTDQDWIMSILLSISKKLKDRTKLPNDDPDYFNPVSFDNYFKPLRKLLDMNNVAVVWKRVYATFPEFENINTDSRGYTKVEIRKMLNHAKGAIDKAIILIASSSGIREGGFEGLRWKDVMVIYKIGNELKHEITESEEKSAQVVCAVLTVYRGSSHEYPAFITPEAYHALYDDYRMEWQKETGRQPKPTDPIFKKSGLFEIPLKPTAIKQRIFRVLRDAGLRTNLPKGKKRHDVPIMNGFRRYFNKINKETISKDSPLAALIKKEFMMEHTGLIKLDKNYFKTHLMELVEEYLQAVPDLTISPEARQKVTIHNLQKEKSELQEKVDEIEDLKQRLVKKEQEDRERHESLLNLLKNEYQKGTR